MTRKSPNAPPGNDGPRASSGGVIKAPLAANLAFRSLRDGLALVEPQRPERSALSIAKETGLDDHTVAKAVEASKPTVESKKSNGLGAGAEFPHSAENTKGEKSGSDQGVPLRVPAGGLALAIAQGVGVGREGEGHEDLCHRAPAAGKGWPAGAGPVHPSQT